MLKVHLFWYTMANFQRYLCRPSNEGIYEKLNELEDIIIDMSRDSKKTSTKQTKKKRRSIQSRSNSISKSSDILNESTKCDFAWISGNMGCLLGVIAARTTSYLRIRLAISAAAMWKRSGTTHTCKVWLASTMTCSVKPGSALWITWECTMTTTRTIRECCLHLWW